MNYKIASLAQKVFNRSPLPLLYLLGWFLGVCMFLQSRRRRTAFKNIKTAFPDRNNWKIYRILRRYFFYLGLSFIESFIAARLYRYTKFKGEIVDQSQGGVCVGIHAGSWELANSFFAQRYKYAILADSQKNKGLNNFLNDQRLSEGVRVCVSGKDMIRCLRENYFVGMVVDQGPEDKAPVVKFFSHDVPTPRGAVYFARKFNKKIYPCFTRREKYFFNTVEIGQPIEIGEKTDQEVLEIVNKFYEERLRSCPWQYFWSYKRFKYKINRDILLISDSKMGHLKQSRALCAFLANEQRYQLRIVSVAACYRWPWMRSLSDALACLSRRHSLTSWLYLRLVLDKPTIDSLSTVYADIVISTGSFIASVNKMMASYLGAKSACILRPNFPLHHFSLALIPEHDRVCADNNVPIKGALTYPEPSIDKVNQCRSFFRLLPGKKAVFFVGGPLGQEEDFFLNFKNFIDNLESFCLEKKYALLVSTSRRTPAQVELYLENLQRERKVFEALVIANRRNYDFVFEGFIGLSDIAFVTSESISMVSEAASLSGACVCVLLEPSDNKRRLFFETVKEDVSLLEAPYNIREVSTKPSRIFERNRERVVKRIGVLF